MQARVPLVEELIPAPDVPAALKALSGWPGVALFDSALRRPGLGRYSFLAADPFAFEEQPVLSTRYSPSDGAEGDPLSGLRARMGRLAVEHLPDLPPFQGGAAGLLSYDLGRAWERLPAPRCDEFRLPAL